MPPTADEIQPRVTVKLKTRASRTRKRTEELVEVEAPRSREGQLNQLTKLVQARFPGAELRVFSDGAGSFTRDDLHVIVAYQGDAKIGFGHRAASTERGDVDDDSPEQLPLTG